jgi:hypothetical protein
MTLKPKSSLSTLAKVVNGLLFVGSLILGFVTFLALTDIVVTLGSAFAIETTPSPYKQSRIAVNLRNFWMLIGGGGMVIFLAGNAEYHGTRLGKESSRRSLMRILVIEVVIISLSFII